MSSTPDMNNNTDNNNNINNNIIINNNNDNDNNNNNNKEYRCPKCSIIPFINIFTNVMSMKCTYNHYYSKTFNEMYS